MRLLLLTTLLVTSFLCIAQASDFQNMPVSQPEAAKAGCCIFPGDANGDMMINVLDATYLIYYLYLGGPPPPCEDEGDPNGTGSINILDVNYLIYYLYKGGPAPVCI